MRTRVRIVPEILGLALAIACVAASVRAEQPGRAVAIEVSPARVDLKRADDAVRVVVTAKLENGNVRDVTGEATFEIVGDANRLAALGDGHFIARADGEVAIEAIWKDDAGGATHTARSEVVVAGCADAPAPHFARDVAPLLSKLGCNGGGCHGKGIGQNGFKLSLFAFDPAFDHAAIAHEGRGRRVSTASPDDSLLLRKATGAVAHGGGVRTTNDSPEYRLLRDWIASGAALGDENAPTEERLEIVPPRRVVDGPAEQRLRVIVHYSDGSSRDVTRVARYDSQSPEIVAVSPDGSLRATGAAGEGYVMIRYGDLVGTSAILSPLGPPLPDEAYAHFAPRNFVDERLLAKWRSLHIAPSSEAGDEEFLRRVHIDVLGKLPTPREVRDFLADGSSDKRERLIDAALDRPEYADLWALKWGEILRNRVGGSNAEENTLAFAKWIRASIADNKPYDRFVREILTVSGKRSDHPQMDWWRQAITHPVRVEDTSQAFLGMRVSCANCHNHPFENVGQTDYWRFAAFFARVDSPTYGSVDEIKLNEEGVVKHPRTDKPLTPKAFGGPEFAYVAGKDPREDLADWLTNPENPFFARSVCNRVWGHYMGVGLVDPVDDMRSTNPPSDPELLDDLTRDFVASGFDLKRLSKTILTSRAYGLTSLPSDRNEADERNYARSYPRRMSPHVLYDALHDATGAAAKLDYKDVARAVQLPNENAKSEFLDMFGRSKRDTPCECGTSVRPNLGQVMYLLHSEELQRMLAADDGVVADLAKDETTNDAIVEELFLRTFSRLPSNEERADAVAFLDAAGEDRRLAVEDLFWTLLNSKEFLFRK